MYFILLNYKVQGIKNLDQWVDLSFYKKTIRKPITTEGYNVKGIYGMNGSGKSGIITSVSILKELLENDAYLNNPIVQKRLDSVINKKLGELNIIVEFICTHEDVARCLRYEISLKKNVRGYFIERESLFSKSLTARDEAYANIYEVKNGEIIYFDRKEEDSLYDELKLNTRNLLVTASLPSLVLRFITEKAIVVEEMKSAHLDLLYWVTVMFFFGRNLHVYMESSDDHFDYIITDYLQEIMFSSENSSEKITSPKLRKLFSSLNQIRIHDLDIISDKQNVILKNRYDEFKRTTGRLESFIQVFKKEVRRIEIEKKEDRDTYVCTLKIVYDSYKVDVEYESTGIKKLIKLFMYFSEMVNGGIVFIDELDANLHDVYLCALLEYLMEYGEGQLCFTTHNVGPMDVLKHNKKSIDFLSVNHKIYPWVNNGNYSPSSLYKNGMIEGSPFNVESIDFIGILDSMVEDD